MNNLVNRHIGLSEADKQQMLQTLGVGSEDELIKQVMPADILLPEDKRPDIDAMTEQEHLNSMHELQMQNDCRRTYIGRGWYGTLTPAVITRNVLENPVWYTSYTP